MEISKNLTLENLAETCDDIVYVEEWVQIKYYEGLYEISSFGRIKSLERKYKNKGLGLYPRKALIKKQNFDGRGNYLCVVLSINKKHKPHSVHRLVAEHFIVNEHNKKCVNHKNGIKTDNRKSNLEWVSYSENMYHAFENGLTKNKKGGECMNAKRVKQLDDNNNIIAVYDSIAEAATAVGLKNQSQIGAVCGGYKYRKTAAGFKWEYA